MGAAGAGGAAAWGGRRMRQEGAARAGELRRRCPGLPVRAPRPVHGVLLPRRRGLRSRALHLVGLERVRVPDELGGAISAVGRQRRGRSTCATRVAVDGAELVVRGAGLVAQASSPLQGTTAAGGADARRAAAGAARRWRSQEGGERRSSAPFLLLAHGSSPSPGGARSWFPGGRCGRRLLLLLLCHLARPHGSSRCGSAEALAWLLRGGPYAGGTGGGSELTWWGTGHGGGGFGLFEEEHHCWFACTPPRTTPATQSMPRLPAAPPCSAGNGSAARAAMTAEQRNREREERGERGRKKRGERREDGRQVGPTATWRPCQRNRPPKQSYGQL